MVQEKSVKKAGSIWWWIYGSSTLVVIAGFVYLFLIRAEIVGSYPVAGMFAIAAPGYALLGWIGTQIVAIKETLVSLNARVSASEKSVEELKTKT